MHTLSYLPGISSDILSAMYPHLLQGKVTCPNDAVHNIHVYNDNIPLQISHHTNIHIHNLCYKNRIHCTNDSTQVPDMHFLSLMTCPLADIKVYSCSHFDMAQYPSRIPLPSYDHYAGYLRYVRLSTRKSPATPVETDLPPLCFPHTHSKYKYFLLPYNLHYAKLSQYKSQEGTYPIQ